MKMYACSKPSGKYSDVNKDNYFTDDENGIAGVFDGVADKGAPASKYAADYCKSRMRKSRTLKDILIRCSRLIYQQKLNSATTAAIVRITDKIELAYAGDSRIYMLNQDGFRCLTLDHGLNNNWGTQTVLAAADNLTDIPVGDRSAFRTRNVITSALGGISNPTVDQYIAEGPLENGEKIILTTDGIHDNLTTAEIEEILVTHQGDLAEALVLHAEARSKEDHFRAKDDDLTAVVIEP